jgi:hypothetical protein
MENFALIGVVAGVSVVALWIWALIDIIKSDFKDTIVKVLWFLLVLLLPLLGFFLYVIIGRSTKQKKVIVESAVVYENSANAKYEDLANAKALLDSGAITEVEFEAEKQKIMGQN